MRPPCALRFVACLALFAGPPGCGAKAASSSSSSSGPEGASKAKLCTPTPAALGLAGAKPLAPWAPPPGCTFRGGADDAVFVRTEAELGAQLECTGAPAGVDLTTHALFVARRMLSPAQIGTDVLDDGKALTFVARQRTTCPDDPHPMPITVPMAFLLPAGETRELKDASCTVAASCK